MANKLEVRRIWTLLGMLYGEEARTIIEEAKAGKDSVAELGHHPDMNPILSFYGGPDMTRLDAAFSQGNIAVALAKDGSMAVFKVRTKMPALPAFGPLGDHDGTEKGEARQLIDFVRWNVDDKLAEKWTWEMERTGKCHGLAWLDELAPRLAFFRMVLADRSDPLSGQPARYVLEPDLESINKTDTFLCQDGEMPVFDLIGGSVDGLARVNDHGNITMYDQFGETLWAIV